jgi:hypothetical protein
MSRRAAFTAKVADAPLEVQQVAATETKLTISRSVHTAHRNERIPAHVWEVLQECGEEAAYRLRELLQSEKFNKLGASNQAQLIRLGFEYVYGKPETPTKQKVSTKLTGDQADAVAASLANLAGNAQLPEYMDLFKEVEPDDE